MQDRPEYLDGLTVEAEQRQREAERIECHARGPDLQGQHTAVGLDLRLQQLFLVLEFGHEESRRLRRSDSRTSRVASNAREPRRIRREFATASSNTSAL